MASLAVVVGAATGMGVAFFREVLDRLKQERQARGRSASTPAEREQVGAFGNAANSTQSVSEALRLVRPIAAMDESAKLAANMERARPRLAEWAQPFAVLMDAVITTYGPLGSESERAAIFARHGRQE